MKQGDKHYEIFYGVDQQRRKSEYTNGEKKETRYYIGDYEIFMDSLGTEHKIHYLSAENGLCAIYVNSGEQDTLYYAFTDYQGNLMALVSQSDGTTKRFSYDPWGNRRSATDWTQRDTLTHHIINRGYTMHEHLDEFNLINMNGRMYDPHYATFLSPDPVLQSPDNWLNYNRYSYCFGNPLKYSDPSGFVTNTSISGQEAEAAERRAQENAKGNNNFDWSDILNLKEGHYENNNGILITTEDLKKFDAASNNSTYNIPNATSNTSNKDTNNTLDPFSSEAKQQYFEAMFKNTSDWEKKVYYGLMLIGAGDADAFIEKYGAYGAVIIDGLLLLYPPYGVSNDACTIITGKDVYGNDANAVDKTMSVIDLLKNNPLTDIYSIYMTIKNGFDKLNEKK